MKRILEHEAVPVNTLLSPSETVEMKRGSPTRLEIDICAKSGIGILDITASSIPVIVNPIMLRYLFHPISDAFSSCLSFIASHSPNDICPILDEPQ